LVPTPREFIKIVVRESAPSAPSGWPRTRARCGIFLGPSAWAEPVQNGNRADCPAELSNVPVNPKLEIGANLVIMGEREIARSISEYILSRIDPSTGSVAD
jgi:hypothetical protein